MTILCLKMVMHIHESYIAGRALSRYDIFSNFFSDSLLSTSNRID